MIENELLKELIDAPATVMMIDEDDIVSMCRDLLEVRGERDAFRAEVERLRAAMPSEYITDRVRNVFIDFCAMPRAEQERAFVEWLSRVEAARKAGG